MSSTTESYSKREKRDSSVNQKMRKRQKKARESSLDLSLKVVSVIFLLVVLYV